ncbi:MAG TPA: hypothetical protein VII13_20565 [Vicinamibacteria bacterium]|jgi:hypothetical protein
MELTTARAVRTRSRSTTPSRRDDRWGWGGEAEALTTITVRDNPVAARDPELGRALEEVLEEALAGAGLGAVTVRFRVCSEPSEVLVFLCKVEGTPVADPGPGGEQFRWWSPLMRTPADLAAALMESLDLRRQRRSGAAPRLASA